MARPNAPSKTKLIAGVGGDSTSVGAGPAAVATWLLTWNPQRYDWADIADDIASIAREGKSIGRWSCGRNQSIAIGDRAFLIRQGPLPRGIVASGTVTKAPFLDDDWRPGSHKRVLYVMVRWESIIDADSNPVLDPRSDSAGPMEQVNWSSQSSGIRIHPDAALDLEGKWIEHVRAISRARAQLPEEVPSDTTMFEGAKRRITVNAYERDPRARDACIKHYGLRCAVCAFDFAKRYGALGAGFIHVHHVVAIATIGKRYKVDPVRDLRPVCPNCHAMLHVGGVTRDIGELRKLLR